jgi:DNA-directed RNA polymerase specialized sigma24 family protein
MGIQMDKPPQDMSLSELADRCASEISKYSHKEAYDDTYCLEIFHRALLLHDAVAWELLQQRFGPTVSSWVRRYPSREAAYRYNTEENYVALAFERFWVASVNNQLEFHSLAAALRFLHSCLNTAILDTFRGYSRSNFVPLEPGSPEEPVSEDVDNKREFWEAVMSLLLNLRERRLAYLLYYCGLKPREIVQLCRDEFNDVQEIYRLRRNILERLIRKKDILRWLLGDEEELDDDEE